MTLKKKKKKKKEENNKNTIGYAILSKITNNFLLWRIMVL